MTDNTERGLFEAWFQAEYPDRDDRQSKFHLSTVRQLMIAAWQGRAALSAAHDAQDRLDAERLDWIERQVVEKSSVWILPCGENLRFVQVRHVGHTDNYPTVAGVRAAIDTAIAQAKEKK